MEEGIEMMHHHLVFVVVVVLFVLAPAIVKHSIYHKEMEEIVPMMHHPLGSAEV